MPNIKAWQQRIHEWADRKGWNDPISSIDRQLLNMISELSEAGEELRNGKTILDVYTVDRLGKHIPGLFEGRKPEGFPIELADCVIRIMHTCEYYGIDLEAVISAKMQYNETRPYRHGNKTC